MTKQKNQNEIEKGKKSSGVICVSCGKEPRAGEAKGSMKHPYCKECFKKVFNNDYNKYEEFMIYKHG